MSTQTASVSIPSIFRTLSTAPRTREHHQAARQLAGLDPKKFLSNLQAAAVNRSPHAIAAVKADMVELEDIFHKLSRSGYDVSAAQRDFEMLSHFVSQLASTQKQRSHTPLPPSTSQPHHSSKPLPVAPVQKYHHDGGHHRTSSLPTSLPSSYEQPRSRTGSFSIVDGTQPSTRYHPHAVHAQVPNNSNSFPTQGRGSAPGTSSSSSSTRSSSSYSSAQSSSSRVVAPAPRHLIKPRRHSEPLSLSSSSSSSASSKKVHFATHATVYTFAQEAPALVPPPRPSCIPRVGGSESPRSTSHDGRSRH